MTKFWILFIPRLLLKNWRRMLLIPLAALFVALAITREPNVDFVQVDNLFLEGQTHYYKMMNGDVLKFDTAQSLFTKGNASYLKTERMPGSSHGLFAVAVIALIAFIVISAMEDWDAAEICGDLIKEHHDTELVDGMWRTHAFGRLIQIDTGNQRPFISLRWMDVSRLFRMERYTPTQKKREDKLNKLGI